MGQGRIRGRVEMAADADYQDVPGPDVFGCGSVRGGDGGAGGDGAGAESDVGAALPTVSLADWLETPGMLIFAALLIEAAVGFPQTVYRLIRHPVVWIGALIALLDRGLNRETWPAAVRRMSGAATLAITAGIVGAAAAGVSILLGSTWYGWLVEAVLASTWLAQRSLHEHVAAVQVPLGAGDIAGARRALSMIVGRDVSQLDEAGIARAATESLAENMSDGIVAPALWGAVLGLPGIAAYKAVNTLDSMIGHRTRRHEAFGWASARFDDLVNLVPARVTAVILAIASGRAGRAMSTALRDAGQHRSPNAGWPEAALAGALGVRLSGPRRYGDRVADEPWLNGAARDPQAADLARALLVYRRGCGVLVLLVAAIACGQALA